MMLRRGDREELTWAQADPHVFGPGAPAFGQRAPAPVPPQPATDDAPSPCTGMRIPGSCPPEPCGALPAYPLPPPPNGLDGPSAPSRACNAVGQEAALPPFPRISAVGTGAMRAIPALVGMLKPRRPFSLLATLCRLGIDARLASALGGAMRGERIAGLLPGLSHGGWPLLGPVAERLLLGGISRVLRKLFPGISSDADARLLLENIRLVVSLAGLDMHELAGAPELAILLRDSPTHGDHKAVPEASPWQDAMDELGNARSVVGDARRAYGSVCRARTPHGLRDGLRNTDPVNPAAGQNGHPTGSPRRSPPAARDPRGLALSRMLAILRCAVILLRMAWSHELQGLAEYVFRCILHMCGMPAG